MKITTQPQTFPFYLKSLLLILTFCFINNAYSQATLETEVKISHFGLYFDGIKVAENQRDTYPDNGTNVYDRAFGDAIAPHGDCIKIYNEYVFMTWYLGDKSKRNMMLTRFNTLTGTRATIKFPHRHTGFQNKWWLGETHNTVAVGISPLNGTIHLLFDMHAYSSTRPTNESLSDDYFRYSYSVNNAATVSDADFKLDLFVKDPTPNESTIGSYTTGDDYVHLGLTGRNESEADFGGLTYPNFFLNDNDELFMWIREGGHTNGAYKFSKYNANTNTWSGFTNFNSLDAPGKNWGLYGDIKYVDGKFRIGFQRRSANSSDKYQLQDGVFYAYSDNQNGTSNWKNHKGQVLQSGNLPILQASNLMITQPGSLVSTTQTNKVRIASNFDWTVTDNGHVHMIGKVQDLQNNKTVYHHTYKPTGETEFQDFVSTLQGELLFSYLNDVYLFSLVGPNNQKRLKIYKTAGGTNNFQPIYEASGGKSFRKMEAEVVNGKAYVFFMENSTNVSSAQPIYLQIIDLGTNSVSNIVHMTKANAPGFAMDGGGPNNTVHLWTANENNVNQQWEEIDQGDGFYSYKLNNTNLALHSNTGGANNQNVFVKAFNTNDENQQWKKVNLGNNTYQLIKKNALGYAIDGGNGGNKGQNVKLWTERANNGNQQWIFTVINNAGKIANVNDNRIIEEHELFSIYPNPTKAILNIDFNPNEISSKTVENGHVKIMDLTSKIILMNPIQKNHSKIDVSSLSKGLYIISIYNGTHYINKKFIKK